MIIYGSKATLIANENIDNKCSHCDTKKSIQMSVFQKYAHIFWIPFFPIGKTAATQCTHCKQELVKKEFDGGLKEKYHRIKSNSRTPIWTFLGIGIVAILIVYSVSISKVRYARNTQFITSPEKGDIHKVKSGLKQYTLFKVNEVANDTVYLLLNQYETNKRTGLLDLEKMGDEAYDEDVLPILKSELKNMFETGDIIDVVRQ